MTTPSAPQPDLDMPADDSRQHPTVAFHTLGCKTNQLETSGMAQQFKRNGWQVVDFDETAQIYVINSCTVTERSDRETERIIRRAKLSNPEGKIAVTGCYAQIAPQQVAAQNGVTNVFGNAEKINAFELLTQAPPEELTKGVPHIQVSELDKSRIMAGGMEAAPDRSRGSLKIQDGCDYKCTYCIIWEARGPSRSLPISDLVAQLTSMLHTSENPDGFFEIGLTGINIGQYECPETGKDLAGLLDALCAIDVAPFRLRLTSLDPKEVTPELVEVMRRHANNPIDGGSGRICPHIHLSAQSAEDYVLKRMGRRHHVADMMTVCEALVDAVPAIAIGSDIIVGFPEETDERFNTTVANLAAVPMHYFHVFSYSKRQGTPAAEFDDQLPEPIKKARAKQLRELSDQKWTVYTQRFIGKPLTMVVESDGLSGLAENYIRLRLESPQPSGQPYTLTSCQLSHFK